MRPTSLFPIIALSLLAGAASSLAQELSPREQFNTALGAFQKNATEDNARKLAELGKQLDPSPAVPEDAEFRAMKGAAFVKQAGEAAAFAKAAGEFRAAIAIAPWVGEYHFNLAVCEKSAGNFTAATAALKFAQIFARTDQERHDNLALRAEIEAAQDIANTKKAAEEKIARAEEEKRRAEQAKRDVIIQIKSSVNNRRYNSFNPSYSSESRHMWDGVTQNELFGSGHYYMFGNYDRYTCYWKFTDLTAELRLIYNDGTEDIWVKGESRGPSMTDMQWSAPSRQGLAPCWAYFSIYSGRLYVANLASNPRPLTDSGFDPNRRYGYSCYFPPD